MRFISQIPKHYIEERNIIDVCDTIDPDGHLSIECVDYSEEPVAHASIYLDKEDLDNLIEHLTEIRANFPNG